MAILPFLGGVIFHISKFIQIHPCHHALQKCHNLLLFIFRQLFAFIEFLFYRSIKGSIDTAVKFEIDRDITGNKV